MPQITDQERLLRDFELVFVSKGPKDGMWRSHFLKCPICGYYVSKGAGYDECPCDNIAIDVDMFRVSVDISSDSEIECYDAVARGR